MSVEMISFIPANARSAPGISAHAAPPAMPRSQRPGSITARGSDGIVSASQLAARAPTTSWPSAPMFQSPIVKARATASPVRMSGIALINVCSIANHDPSAPIIISRYAARASCPVDSRNTAPIRNAMTIAPTRIPTTSSHSGTPGVLPESGSGMAAPSWAEGLPADEQALLVSPRELANPHVLVRRPDLEGGHEGTRLRARRRPAHERPTGNRGHAVVTQHGALGDGEGRDQALAESILGNIGDASPPSLARAGPRDVPAVQGHAARQRRPQASDDLEELPLTAAGHAGDAQDLVAPHLERHLVEGDTAAIADRAHLLHDERRRAGSQRLRALDRHIVPDHELSQVARRGRRGTRLTDNPSGAEDDDAIGDGQHLVQLVADEHRRAPLARQTADRREERLALLRSEHRSWLVEDEQPPPSVEHFQDLDSLPLADRQLPDARPRIDGETVVSGEPLHRHDARLEVEQERGAVPPEEHVLGGGEALDEAEVLVHHADPELARVARRAQVDEPPVERDGAGIGPVETGQDAHERGLAGPVLPEDGQHLTGVDGQVDPGVGHGAGEGLDDPPKLDERVRHRPPRQWGKRHAAHLAVGACPSIPCKSQSKPRISLRLMLFPSATRTRPPWSLSGPLKIGKDSSTMPFRRCSTSARTSSGTRSLNGPSVTILSDSPP